MRMTIREMRTKMKMRRTMTMRKKIEDVYEDDDGR